MGILRAADRIYLVCTPEITSLHLAKRKIDRMRSLGIPSDKLRLLLNRSGSNRGLDAHRIEKITGVPVQWALDNDYKAVAEAALRGGLVPANTALAQQLEQLGELILNEFGAAKGAATPQQEASAPAASKPVSAEQAGEALKIG
jgi:Flp pilus assembly CpaE family ATPase